MDGILLVDKPVGWTSHDVVAKVRSLLRQELSIKNNELSKPHNSKYIIHNSPRIKVGHTGTLDPMATGLLVLVLGGYTKRAGEFSKLSKVYDAKLTLGAVSSTGDSEGEIAQKSTQEPPESAVRAVLSTFLGGIEQIPPQYSAVKISGQRAYALARKGKEVQLEPRQVTVYSLQLTDYSYPKLSFTCKVSSGTYIRSLAADIGEALGTGAYLSRLRRTEVGAYTAKEAQPIDKETSYDIIKHVIQTPPSN